MNKSIDNLSTMVDSLQIGTIVPIARVVGAPINSWTQRLSLKMSTIVDKLPANATGNLGPIGPILKNEAQARPSSVDVAENLLPIGNTPTNEAQ